MKIVRSLLAGLVVGMLAFAPVAAPAQSISSPGFAPPVAASCGTVTVSTPCFDLSQTWNNSGTAFTGLKFNATNTASASGSLLLDLQVGGASKFSVDKLGGVTSASGFNATGSETGPVPAFGNGSTFGWVFNGSRLILRGAANSVLSMGDGSGNLGIRVGSVWAIGWASGADSSNGYDLLLFRDAANTLGIRNSTSAQAVKVFNTFTDGSNGEWGAFDWTTTANALTIGSKANGTGTLRRVAFVGTHFDFGGSAPSVTSCGTSPSISGSDTAGEVTTGTGSPTACTITFAVAYTAQPYCVVQDRSAVANLTSYTVSTTAITLTTSAASSQKVAYVCHGA